MHKHVAYIFIVQAAYKGLGQLHKHHHTEKMENYTYTPVSCFSETILMIQDARLALKSKSTQCRIVTITVLDIILL